MQPSPLSSGPKPGIFTRCLAFIICVIMALPLPGMAAPGGTTNNSGLIPFSQAYFAFEVEGVLATLKEESIWDETEQMIDNPYAIADEPTVAGNSQGFPSYRSTLDRRRSFVYRLNGDISAAGVPCAPGTANCVEVPLSRFIVHSPNYNHMNGEELRLLNIEFTGAPWTVPDVLVRCDDPTPPPTCPNATDTTYGWAYRAVDVLPGIQRIEEDEAAIDFNSPVGADVPVCILTPEVGLVDSQGRPVPEGSTICGGDPGEPGYEGFGVLAADLTTAYSTPAVPGGTANPDGTKNSVVGLPLFDPARGIIGVRDPATGDNDGSIAGSTGLLRKPSLRIVEVLGTGSAPNYAWNSQAQLESRAIADGDDIENAAAFLAPSNENDYIRGATRAEKVTARGVATVLGKALFWDMQVGSDGVQACASCHFHAGADNRTKNQLTPNHVGPKGNNAKFEIEGRLLGNKDVSAGHFPFHKLANTDIIGDPACTTPMTATSNTGAITTICDKNNILSDSDDVMSSMGVVFRRFVDVKVGANAFVPGTNPPVLKRDTANFPPDPVAVFQDIRRVEPRNTPTLFGTAFNFDNFWDGRARHDFNGGSVFGASDPQPHVMIDMGDGNLQATRQMIRFASLASLATGPALSNFEMSGDGRNWAKLGKKLLQPGVTPLANQLVDPLDSVLGPYSNQNGSACAGLAPEDRSPGTPAPGKPGLCISYPGLIRNAFYPALWQNTSMHLNGCYTDGRSAIHPNQCAPGSVVIPVFNAVTNTVEDSDKDPFDNYVLSVAAGSAGAANTNQFSQMEANMPLFFGLSVQTWGNILIPDDTPMDRFYDANPDSFVSFGESGEPGLVLDLLNCSDTGGVQPCFTEVGNFKRDPDAVAYTGRTFEGDTGIPVPAPGTRQVNDQNPLLGMDFFLGSNLSLKNPNFRSLRCGECHAATTLTDNTINISHQLSFIDFAPEFVTPGVEVVTEPLGRDRVITGFSLESEINGNAQDAIERNIVDLCVAEPCVDDYGNPIPGGVAGGFPQGQALLDNGVYNLGIRPIIDDLGRGGNDAFGWPLSLSYLMLKNLGGAGYHPGGNNSADGFRQPLGLGGIGIPLPNWEPDPLVVHPDTGLPGDPVGGGLFVPTAQDQQINPGFEEEPANPLLPPHLAPWVNNIVVGDETEQDEIFIGLNTVCAEPILEGFVDTFGPFNPAATVGENYNNARQPAMATWPNVNRVNTQGAFKAAPLRNVELTGPYFHTGSKLTLRQQLDFYERGGDFTITNKSHRDFLLVNLRHEDEALGGCVDPTVVDVNGRPTRPNLPCNAAGAVPEFTEEEKEAIMTAVIDFLLELTDERVAFERAPFDHPEIFVPLDGKAPDNTFGRDGFLARLANGKFRQVAAVGEGGNATKLPNFLGVSSLKRTLPDGSPNPAFPAGAVSHYDSVTGFAELTLIAPNGGETISSAQQFTISWDGPAGAHHYRIEFSRDNGNTWRKIAGPIDGATKTYAWSPHNPVQDRTHCLIRVLALRADGTIIEGDRSNGEFTLLHIP